MIMTTELIVYNNPQDRSTDFYKLDLYGDIAIPVTFSIADIREPDKRKADFSKTITIPGTKHNNEVFNHLYEIGVDSTYDPRLKKEITLVQDGFEILKGIMEVTSIKRDDYYVVEYNVTLSGKLSNIFYNINDAVSPTTGGVPLLQDLDLSAYDHEYNVWNVKNSWDTKIKKNGVDYLNFSYSSPISLMSVSYDAPSDRAMLHFATPHAFAVGDKLWINSQSFDLGNYQGNYTVTAVPTSTSIIINNEFNPLITDNGINPMGTVMKVEVTGEGYVYPMINYNKASSAQESWAVTDFLPAVYVKTVWDKIFEDAGFEYQSNFINSQYFKRLVMPATSNVTKTDAELRANGFRAGTEEWDPCSHVLQTGVPYTGTASSPVVSLGVIFNNDSSDGFYDPGNIYDNVTGACTIVNDGTYNVTTHIELNPYNKWEAAAQALADSGGLSCLANIVGTVDLVVTNSGGRTVVASQAITYFGGGLNDPVYSNWPGYGTDFLRQQFPYTWEFSVQGITAFDPYTNDLGVYNYGNIARLVGTGSQDGRIDRCNEGPPGTPTMDRDFFFVDFNETLNLRIGDVLTVEISYEVTRDFTAGNFQDPSQYFGYYTGDAGIPSSIVKHYFSGQVYMAVKYGTFKVEAQSVITAGDIVELENYMPKNVKQTDFLTSIFKLFNLYVETDKLVENRLYIEPRNDFYSQTDSLDWTTKLDISKPLEINPMGEATAKTYKFTYALDKDWKNEEYNKIYEETYGQVKYESINDFVKSEKVVSVLFASTPTVDDFNDQADKVIPWIVKDGLGQRLTAIPRILHYNGFNYAYNTWRLNNQIGSFYQNPNKPSVRDVVIASPTKIDVYFTRTMDNVTASTLSNFGISGTGAPTITSVGLDTDNDFLVHILLSGPLSNTNPTTITINAGYTGDDTQANWLRDSSEHEPTGSPLAVHYNIVDPFTYTFENFITYPYLYPSASHFDRPQDPTLDLNFGPTQVLYHGPSALSHATKYTDNNLFNRFYRQFIEEITDKDSKIVTGSFYLRPSDMYNLDFKKIYYVDGHAMRLQKVADYNAKNPGVTKCEFLKIKSGVTFVPDSTLSGLGGVGSPVPPVKPPVYVGTIGPNKVPNWRGNINQITGSDNTVGVGSSGNTVNGIGNTIGTAVVSATVHGNNNWVGSGSTNVVIQGDNNVVPNHYSNVTIIGMSGVTATEPNTAYINGVKISGGVYTSMATLIDAGNNTPLLQFGSVKPYQVIDAGLDQLLAFGSMDPVVVIDGGRPTPKS